MNQHPLIILIVRFVFFRSQELTLRYNNQNLYELYIKNPGSELILALLHTEPPVGEPDDPLWICEIRKGQWILSNINYGSKTWNETKENELYSILWHQVEKCV